MDVLQSSALTYAGINFEFVHDPSVELTLDNIDEYGFITYKSAENFFEWAPNLARKKLAAKSLKAFTGEDFQLGKANVKDSRGKLTPMGVLPMGIFLRVVLWQADQGNSRAKALVSSGFLDSFRSLTLEQHTGKPVSLKDRQRKTESDRNAFYAQYAAGISDQEWLEQSGVGSMLGLDMGKTSHWVTFDSGYVPSFLSATVTSGKDPDEILEEMRQKYE
jgi:hypothetical protein